MFIIFYFLFDISYFPSFFICHLPFVIWDSVPNCFLPIRRENDEFGCADRSSERREAATIQNDKLNLEMENRKL